MENRTISTNFSITGISKTNNRDYIEALKIYNMVTPREIKTDSNEITKMLENEEKEDFKVLGFILKYSDKVSGLAILSYLEDSKSILIEYIAIENSIRNNVSFLTYLNLLQTFISELPLDVAYWIVEISNKDNGKNVDKESRFFRKLLYLENFGELKALYHTLQIGFDNFESSFEAKLYIQADDNVPTLSRQTYIQIVKSVYSYSVEWFKIFNSDNLSNKFEEKTAKNLIEIEKSTKNNPKVHIEYSNYGSLKNKDYIENTSKLLPSEENISNKKIFLFAIMGLTIGVGLIFGMNKLLDYLGIKMSEINSIVGSVFTIIFAPIVSILIGKNKKKL
ncbi:hypothetical protein [Enterococcus sp. AZ126]|uniref:hypothetical protein n=1 Tax=Enterococcus sp. AZ126 TaxID=2774635 RepID=UPI003F22A018